MNGDDVFEKFFLRAGVFGERFPYISRIPPDKINERFATSAPVTGGADIELIRQQRNVADAMSVECAAMYVMIQQYVIGTSISCYVLDGVARTGITLEVPKRMESKTLRFWSADGFNYLKSVFVKPTRDITCVRDDQWDAWDFAEKRAIFVYDKKGTSLIELHTTNAKGREYHSDLGGMMRHGFIAGSSQPRVPSPSVRRAGSPGRREKFVSVVRPFGCGELGSNKELMNKYADVTAHQIVGYGFTAFLAAVNMSLEDCMKYRDEMKREWGILRCDPSSCRFLYYNVLYSLHIKYETSMCVMDTTHSDISCVLILGNSDEIVASARVQLKDVHNTACFFIDGNCIYAYDAPCCGLDMKDARKFHTDVVTPYMKRQNAHWLSTNREVVDVDKSAMVGDTPVTAVRMPCMWHNGVYNTLRYESIKILMAYAKSDLEIRVDDYLLQSMYEISWNSYDKSVVDMTIVRDQFDNDFEIFIIDEIGDLKRACVVDDDEEEEEEEDEVSLSDVSIESSVSHNPVILLDTRVGTEPVVDQVATAVDEIVPIANEPAVVDVDVALAVHETVPRDVEEKYVAPAANPDIVVPIADELAVVDEAVPLAEAPDDAVQNEHVVDLDIRVLDTLDPVDKRVPHVDDVALAVHATVPRDEHIAPAVNPDIVVPRVDKVVENIGVDEAGFDGLSVEVVPDGIYKHESVGVVQVAVNSSNNDDVYDDNHSVIPMPLAFYFALALLRPDQYSLYCCDMYKTIAESIRACAHGVDYHMLEYETEDGADSYIVLETAETRGRWIEWYRYKVRDELVCTPLCAVHLLRKILQSGMFTGTTIISIDTVGPKVEYQPRYKSKRVCRFVCSEIFKNSRCAVWYIYDDTTEDVVRIVRSGSNLSVHAVELVTLDLMLAAVILSTCVIGCVVFQKKNVIISANMVPPCSVTNDRVVRVNCPQTNAVVNICGVLNDEVDFWNYVKVWCLWHHVIIEPTSIEVIAYKYRVLDYDRGMSSNVMVHWENIMTCLFQVTEDKLIDLLYKYDQRRDMRVGIGEYSAYLICEETTECVCVKPRCGSSRYGKFDLKTGKFVDGRGKAGILQLSTYDLVFVLRKDGRLYEVVDDHAPILLRNYTIGVFPELAAAPSALTMSDLYRYKILADDDYIIWDEMFIKPDVCTCVRIFDNVSHVKRWVSLIYNADGDVRYKVSDKCIFDIKKDDTRSCIVRKSTHMRQDVYMNRHGATLKENMHDYLCAYVGWLDEYGVC